MSGLVPSLFPYFGGKRAVADAVWARFGKPQNYVEPFAGSLAVLLSRPHLQGTETVNDKDRFLANFWRAVRFDPDCVAEWADWPVNEADLHARHLWLVTEGARRLDGLDLEDNPFACDPQIAGWWWWGICQWIGTGWCVDLRQKRPQLGYGGKGINRTLHPSSQMRHLTGGRGLNRVVAAQTRRLSGSQGINRRLGAVSSQIPHISDGGLGLHRGSHDKASRADYIRSLVYAAQERLRDVRVCCGDWSRVLGPSPTTHLGMTAVFLDPPYSQLERHGEIYAVDSEVSVATREWAIANGDNPLLRIALCGYRGEHEMPPSWAVFRWKARGGYGSQGNNRARDNASRETIWFSPACIDIDKPSQAMFDLTEQEQAV